MMHGHLPRAPRTLGFIGFAVAISGIAAELALNPSTAPDRFPDWYLPWFWVPATWVTLVVCCAAAFRPHPGLTRFAATCAVVWCLGRAALNFYARWSEVLTADEPQRAADYARSSIGGLLFIGLATLMLALGLATARSDGRQVAGSP